MDSPPLGSVRRATRLSTEPDAPALNGFKYSKPGTRARGCAAPSPCC